MRLVDFFIAGVQKGGTTAIDSYLRGHPSIQMARVKEAHHFDNEALDWSAPEHGGLHGQFDWSVDGVLRGEATPIYTYWPSSLARLADYNPAAKIVVGLRHPAFRAFSHWRMETSRQSEHLSFEEAISEDGRQRVRSASNGAHRVYSYVERGFYAGQIESVFALFPRRQVHVFRTDELWTDPAGTLSAIERFLGVAPVLGATIDRRYIVSVDASHIGAVMEAAEAHDALAELYRDDIVRTGEITGLDLSDWLERGYQEPMAPVSP